MAYGELLLVGGFPEGAAEGLVVEERVVAEAASAARVVDNPPFDSSPIDTAHVACLDQRNGTDEAGGPVRDAAQILEQQPVVRLVGGVFARVARRVDAGRSAERVDFQAGI